MAVQVLVRRSSRRLQTKQKNRRTKPSASGGVTVAESTDVKMEEEEGEGEKMGEGERERKLAFAQLTDLCAQSVTEGWLDVYQCTHEQLMEESKEDGEEKGNAKEGEEEEYVVKASVEASSMQGPFTVRELVEAVRNGEVTAAEAVVRKVGTTAWEPLQSMPALRSHLAAT